MVTSSFHKSSSHKFAVSIARTSPYNFHGRFYAQLAPSYDLLMTYKLDHDEEKYRTRYYDEVLSKLDPHVVWSELGPNAVLLCWGRFR